MGRPERDLQTITRRGLFAGAAFGGVAALGVRAAAADTNAAGARPPDGTLREYWLSAEPFHHNLVPSGRDGMTGRTITQAPIWMLRYRAYTPGWGAPLPASRELGPNSGMPGPTLRANVGDTLRIHFRNADTHFLLSHSIHPHGVFYVPSSDGSWANDFPDTGGAVAPGDTRTYEWRVREDSVGSWPYHDHSKPGLVNRPNDPTCGPTTMLGPGGVMELGAQLGLFGMIAVTDASTPAVDREFVLFFHDLYASDVPGIVNDWDLFNGRAFLGNTPLFRAKPGERVRWRVATLGTEFHVFHVHGHRWRDAAGNAQDSAILGPSMPLTVEWTEDNPGRWLYHCHVVDHMMGGMVGEYRVR